MVKNKNMAKNTKQTKRSKKKSTKNKNLKTRLFTIFRKRKQFLFIFVLLFALVGAYFLWQSNAAATTYYVSPTGSDSNPGTSAAPWRTIKKSITSLQPGDTLIVGGGTYVERVKSSTGSLHLTRGTAALPITVMAAVGQRPVIKGLLWTRYADYWTWNGINVMWDDATGTRTEHMVKFHESNNLRLTNSEIWGARSFAGLLIGNDVKNFTIDNNYFHDTYPSNDLNQDHLIYIGGLNTGPGVIERNIFANSPNGRGIKIGHGSGDTTPMGYATIRFNTFYANTGPSNIQFSYGATGNKVYRNIMQKSNSHNVTDFSLAGKDNEVWENIGWESRGVLSSDVGIVDKGGNMMRNPLFTDVQNANFIPLDELSKAYGKYAPGNTSDDNVGDDTAVDILPPHAPTNLKIASSDRKGLSIAWDASSDNVEVTGYRIYRDDKTSPIATTQSLNYTDKSVKPNKTYTYYVTAIDAAKNESAQSNTVTGTSK